MALKKQAKPLTPDQINHIADWITTTRQDGVRDLVVFYLSVYAGLRAKEIACLDWSMVTDAEGTLVDTLSLPNIASKGRTGGRHIPMSHRLYEALEALHAVSCYRAKGPVITTRDGGSVTSAYVVKRFGYWYSLLDMNGCSSHSGRRTFISAAARKITEHGGSLRDVQSLAGHSSLHHTQTYIMVNETAKRSVVNDLW
jgi:integrase/recombinase XerD